MPRATHCIPRRSDIVRKTFFPVLARPPVGCLVEVQRSGARKRRNDVFYCDHRAPRVHDASAC